MESHESPATLSIHISSGRSALASKLYLGSSYAQTSAQQNAGDTKLDVLHISLASSSCPGGLPHSSLGSDLDFFVRNVLYRPEKSEPDGAARYLLEPPDSRDPFTTQLGSNFYTLLFDDGDPCSSDARSLQFYQQQKFRWLLVSTAESVISSRLSICAAVAKLYGTTT